jgi:negative regulator of flagellin synthesis FlgM
MKIMNTTTPKPATATATAAPGSRAGSKGVSTAATASAGSVLGSASPASPATTDATGRLSQLEAQFAQSDFDADKVNEVTAAIASGKYKVNAGAVADKLLESAASLSGKSRTNG